VGPLSKDAFVTAIGGVDMKTGKRTDRETTRENESELERENATDKVRERERCGKSANGWSRQEDT